MVARIGIMVLRLSVLLALILGVIRWITGQFSPALQGIHQLFGLLVTLSLWALAYALFTAPKGKNPGLAIGAIVLGLVILFVGLTQTNILYLTPSTHWLIQVIHLLLGLGGAGMGEAIAGRLRRLNPPMAQ